MPFGVSAQPRGSVPTGIVSTTRHSAQVDDRDGAADAVGDVRLLVVRVDRHAAGLEADRDLGQLDGDVIALRVFHSE